MKISHLSRQELELLFHECHKHLNAVSGSRNSFHPDIREKILDTSEPLRTEGVEKIHQKAVEFLIKNPY